MQTTTISQYIDSIANPDGLFRTLKNIVPHRRGGEVAMISGNNSVVFMAETDNGTKALKCFTRQIANPEKRSSYFNHIDSTYITPYQYMPREIYVFDSLDKGSWRDIAVYNWIEGHTLLRELKRLCHSDDRTKLKELAKKFDRMALWLLDQDFAHADLKHDNILIDTNGSVRLIDLDDCYIPELHGHASSSLGSPAFQHPGRDKHFFDKHLDDYSLALISLSLHALAHEPALLAKYNDSENIILDAREIASGKSQCFRTINELFVSSGNNALIKLCDLLLSPEPTLRSLPATLSQISDGLIIDTDTSFEIIDDNNSNYALVMVGGLYGYGNTDNMKLVIDPIYSDAQPFSEGLAAVTLRGRRMFVDKNGLCAIDCYRFNSADSFRGGLAKVSILLPDKSSRFGFIDNKGEVVISPEYETATSFREGISCVKRAGKWFAIDRKGVVSSENYTSLEELRVCLKIIK